MNTLSTTLKITDATALTVATVYACKVSSAVEPPTDNGEVTGSNPVPCTTGPVGKIRVPTLLSVSAPTKAPNPRPIALREGWRLPTNHVISGEIQDQQGLQNPVAGCDTRSPDRTQRQQRQRYGASTDRFTTCN